MSNMDDLDFGTNSRRLIKKVSLFRGWSRSKSGVIVGGRVKRAIDICLALCGLIILSPLFFLVALAVRLSSPGPALYGHRRVGAGGKAFFCWKFRSMVFDGDRVLQDYFDKHPAAQLEWQANRKLRDDPRVTPLGRVLRAYSVDELPQLLNVLNGSMSLVGPRPVAADELNRYGDAAELYLSARPGITGLWQVSGRSSLSYDYRVQLDAHYLQNWTVGRDISILLRTVPAILYARGSY